MSIVNQLLDVALLEMLPFWNLGIFHLNHCNSLYLHFETATNRLTFPYNDTPPQKVTIQNKHFWIHRLVGFIPVLQGHLSIYVFISDFIWSRHGLNGSRHVVAIVSTSMWTKWEWTRMQSITFRVAYSISLTTSLIFLIQSISLGSW